MQVRSFAESSGPNKSMALLLVLLISSIYIWVSKEDAVATQYSSCSRFGVAAPSVRTLILEPHSLIGSHAALAIAKAGHKVYLLLDPSHRNTEHHHDLVNSYIAAEMTPIYFEGTSRNVSSITKLVETHGITTVIDTKPLEFEGQPNQLNLVKRLQELGKTSGIKRTYIYTTGCLLSSLDKPVVPPPAAAFAKHTQGGSYDVPANVPLSPAQYESEIRSLGLKRNTDLYVIILRPGVIYGGAGWAISPLKHFVQPTSHPNVPADAIFVAYPPSIARSKFSGLHFHDLLQAFVSVLHYPTHRDLNGEVYDLQDETKIDNGEVQVMLARAAGFNGRVIEATERDGSQTVQPKMSARRIFQHSAQNGGSKIQKLANEIDNAGGDEPTTPSAQSDANAASVPPSVDIAAAVTSTSAASSITILADEAWSFRQGQCAASRPSTDKFRTITKWMPNYKKFNEESMLPLYVSAIRVQLQREEKKKATPHATLSN